MCSPDIRPLQGHRRIGSNSAIDRTVVDLVAAQVERFFKDSVTERIAQIPCDRLHNQPSLKMPVFGSIFRLPLQFVGDGIQKHG